MSEKIKILGNSAIHAKLDRMAWEIYESNYAEQEVFLVGVDERGGFIAKELAARLISISPLRISVLSATKTPEGIQLQTPEKLTGKVALIVDDVLYSGTTFFNVLTSVMQQKPMKVQTAALIDRGHRILPVSADFVGMDMATTLKQHVSVEMTPDGRVDAYIN